MAQHRYSLPSNPTAIPRQSSSPLRASNLSAAARPGSSTPTFGSSIPPPGIFASPSPPLPSRSPVGAGPMMQPFSYPGAESRPASTGRARVESTAEPESMREWSFFGVDITISNVHALAIDVPPASPTSTSGDLGRRPPSALSTSEVFTTSFGGGRWKLVILRPAAPSPTLSLYLSCNLLETSFSASTIPTTLMFGIREPKEQVGKREGRDGWIWRVWENEWCFGAGSEYWECHSFPSLDVLLQNPRIAALDSFVLSIQIQSPPAQSTIPQMQDSHHVPRDLLAGLQTLLDDQPTADVLFYMHERHPSPPSATDADISNASTAPEEVQTYRKRTIYAHSAILRARSTYFADMLTAGWAETSGEGRVKNVVRIEDFDFVTVYWLLHYLYTNEITFQHRGRPRPASLRRHPLWLARFPLPTRLVLDASLVLLPPPNPPPPRFKLLQPSRPPHRHCRILLLPPALETYSRDHNSRQLDRREAKGWDSRSTFAYSRLPRRGTDFSATRRSGLPHHCTRKEVPQRDGGRRSASHPVAVTEPASAFAIYRNAHRYSLHALASLALAQVVQGLTPKTAFPLLLATHLWPELHGAIKGYALAHFYEICAEPELARCYAEVGEGMWENGGAVLLDWTLNLTPAWT